MYSQLLLKDLVSLANFNGQLDWTHDKCSYCDVIHVDQKKDIEPKIIIYEQKYNNYND